jgi:hypothetical protein
MNPITSTEIRSLIHQVRGKAVMLDKDLAELYGVETRALNQAVKRNIQRFPEDFMFTLTRDEILRISQLVTSLKFSKNVNVFTEQGVAMLSSVLSSENAILVNINIMRAFVQFKRLGMTILDIRRKLENIEKKYDHQFKIVFDAIRQLLTPPPEPPKKIKIGFTPPAKR